MLKPILTIEEAFNIVTQDERQRMIKPSTAIDLVAFQATTHVLKMFLLLSLLLMMLTLLLIILTSLLRNQSVLTVESLVIRCRNVLSSMDFLLASEPILVINHEFNSHLLILKLS